MKSVVFITITALFFIGQSTNSAYGQLAKWRSYSVPDKSFSVELPTPLEKVSSFEGEHGASRESDEKSVWVVCYAGIETTPRESRFGVIVIDGSLKQFKIKSKKRAEFLDDLSRMLIGDDDEEQFMRQPNAIKQNGVIGKEYFYIKKASSGFDLFILVAESLTQGRKFTQ